MGKDYDRPWCTTHFDATGPRRLFEAPSDEAFNECYVGNDYNGTNLHAAQN